jgi:hypothetical protein
MNTFRIFFVISCCASPILGQGVNPLSFTRLSPTQFQLSWYANMLRPYQIENSPDLHNWTALTGYIEGTNTQQGVLVTKTADKMFFRLKTGATRTGFDTHAMYPNDDGSTGLEPIGFPINVFPTTENPGPWTDCYVNNNGNISIGTYISYFTPLPLQSSAQTIYGLIALLAPFWADVDTDPAGYPETAQGSKVVTFGQGLVDERPAFGVNWRDVGYYNNQIDKLNSFQIVLIDRSNIGISGDFDVEFNYDTMLWETGYQSGGSNGYGGYVGRVGITNGINQTIEAQYSAETIKQLDYIPNGFPNAGTNNYTSGLIYRKRNSTIPGRMVFQFRNGNLLGALQVNAGPDQSLGLVATTASLAGIATDPSGGAVTAEWSVLYTSSGTPVVLTNPSLLNTTVSFGAGSTTDLLLTVRRVSDPSVSASDVMTIKPY